MSGLRVVAIDARHHDGEPGRVAGAPRHRAGCVVELADARGRVGRGECAPLPGFSRDTLDDCVRELAGLSAPALALDAPLLPQLRALPVRAPALRFAIETALLDLAGQTLGRPLAALLAAPPRTAVPLSALLAGDEVRAEAAAARARGIATVKIKLGRVRGVAPAALRDAIGDELALRLDANQAGAWTPRELAAARPELVEEPLAGGLVGCDPRALGELAVAADESLLAPAAWPGLVPLVHAGRLRALVLKPMALGGFSACFALAALAVEHDVALVVTHLWDGPIALAAACALALALPGRVLACGLDRHAGLAAWPPRAIAALGEATIRATDAPGLGA